MYDPHDLPGPAHSSGCRVCAALVADGTRRALGLPTRLWYVSARNGARSRLVAGPFDRLADAVGAVDAARAKVTADYSSDPRATFASFGVASSSDRLPTLYGDGSDDALDPLAVAA